MTTSPTHYAVLGLARTASQKDIRSAFKQSALRHHPDKNPEGEAQFKRVNRAYAVLSDEKSRRKYDTEIETAAEKAWQRPAAAATRRPSSGTTQNHHTDKYAHYNAQYDHSATRSFINKIMEEDRCVQRHKMDQSFASWYKTKQNDWRDAEAAVEAAATKAHQVRLEEERQAAMREQRLRDIEEELVRNKAADEVRREREQEVEIARMRDYERRKAAALEEIEEEERKYKHKFEQLSSKWAVGGSNVQLVRQHRLAQQQEREKQKAEKKRASAAAALNNVTSPSNGMLEEEALDATLQELRRQRDELKAQRTKMKMDQAEAWKSLADLKAANHEWATNNLDTHRTSGGSLFSWNEPAVSPTFATTAAEELYAARMELKAEEARVVGSSAGCEGLSSLKREHSGAPPRRSCSEPANLGSFTPSPPHLNLNSWKSPSRDTAKSPSRDTTKSPFQGNITKPHPQSAFASFSSPSGDYTKASTQDNTTKLPSRDKAISPPRDTYRDVAKSPSRDITKTALYPHQEEDDVVVMCPDSDSSPDEKRGVKRESHLKSKINHKITENQLHRPSNIGGNDELDTRTQEMGAAETSKSIPSDTHVDKKEPVTEVQVSPARNHSRKEPRRLPALHEDTTTLQQGVTATVTAHAAGTKTEENLTISTTSFGDQSLNDAFLLD